MRLYIKNIILYPRNRSLSPRIISFKEDKINIITGNSQKGKSAIIDIIDYCLGSGECNIPVGTIRDSVEVFALYLKLGEEYLFLARDNYNDSKTTMYFYKENKKGENLSLRTNEWLENKSQYRQNLKYVKTILSELAGFKNIKTNEDSDSPFDTPASFRDTAAFQFQTQNIIANPSTMFYKTDTWEHLQKLKTVFPLILGYKSYDILKLDKEINELESEKKKLSLKLEDIKKQYESWQSDIYEYYAEAVNLGLTNSDVDISTSTVSLLQNELSRIVTNAKNGILYKKGAANRFSEKTKDLNDKRRLLIRELDKLKNTLFKIEELSDSKELYLSDVAAEKENRLKPIEWFLKQKGTNICPFCDSVSTKAIDELLSLNEEKIKNQIVLNTSKSLSLSFDKERSTIKNEIKKNEDLIEKIDNNMRIILLEAKEDEQSYQRTFEFIGKIEHAINNLEKIAPSGILETNINELQKHIDKIRKKLKSLESQFDKSLSLNKLTKLIGKYIKIFPIEKSASRKVHLDPDQSLNIKIEDTVTQNKYFLSRLGSGANYMGYHISTMLGLHEFFYKLKDTGKPNFIPSFLVLDQPSQVYYPDNYKEENGTSKDIQDTKKIFEALNEFMKNTDYQIQIIVLEHVPDSIWAGINDKVFNISGIWRNNETGSNGISALIPEEWL